jgi:diacylglycerol kinase (ATP)
MNFAHATGKKAMQQLKSSKLAKSLCHSWSGIMLLAKNESSVVLELTFLPATSIILPYFFGSFKDFLILISINLAILAVEALNSAIEKVCDLITLERHEKIKYAKDAGSFAVLCILVVYLIYAICVIYY